MIVKVVICLNLIVIVVLLLDGGGKMSRMNVTNGVNTATKLVKTINDNLRIELIIIRETKKSHVQFVQQKSELNIILGDNGVQSLKNRFGIIGGYENYEYYQCQYFTTLRLLINPNTTFSNQPKEVHDELIRIKNDKNYRDDFLVAAQRYINKEVKSSTNGSLINQDRSQSLIKTTSNSMDESQDCSRSS
ncbi:2703_t:CDS:2, partial [Racocetra persica]